MRLIDEAIIAEELLDVERQPVVVNTAWESGTSSL